MYKNIFCVNRTNPNLPMHTTAQATGDYSAALGPYGNWSTSATCREILFWTVMICVQRLSSQTHTAESTGDYSATLGYGGNGLMNANGGLRPIHDAGCAVLLRVNTPLHKRIRLQRKRADILASHWATVREGRRQFVDVDCNFARG